MLLTYMRARLGLNNELDNESGQALVEYALIISLVALVAAVGLAFLGGKVSDMFTNIGSRLPKRLRRKAAFTVFGRFNRPNTVNNLRTKGWVTQPFRGWLETVRAIHQVCRNHQLPSAMREVGTKGEQMLLTYMRARLGLNNERKRAARRSSSTR